MALINLSEPCPHKVCVYYFETYLDVSSIMLKRSKLAETREVKEEKDELVLGPIKTNETELYIYTPIEIKSDGPPVPSDEEMANLGNLAYFSRYIQQ